MTHQKFEESEEARREIVEELKITRPHLMPFEREIIPEYLLHFIPFLLEGAPGIGKSISAMYWGAQVYAWLWDQLTNEERRKRARLLGSPDDLFEARKRFITPLKLEVSEDVETRDIIGEFDFVQYFADLQAKRELCGDGGRYFRKGKLCEAAEQGRLIIVEELDRAGRPSVFSLFFDALEYKRINLPPLPRIEGGVAPKDHIDAIVGFNVVITANRRTDTGTVPFPEALTRRLRRVILFDPSEALEGHSTPVDLEAAKLPEDEQRLEMVLSFERKVIASNLSKLSNVQERAIDKGTPKAFAPISHLDGVDLNGPVMEIFLECLLRAVNRLRMAFQGTERISPAEVVKLVEDLIVCRPDALDTIRNTVCADDADPEGLVDMTTMFIGSLGKLFPDQNELRSAFGTLLGEELVRGSVIHHHRLEDLIKPRYKAGQRVVSPTRIVFRFVPAGTFMMGDDRYDSNPSHEVTISRPFLIAEEPFTRADDIKFRYAEGGRSDWPDTIEGYFEEYSNERPDHPKTKISLSSVAILCNGLSAVEVLEEAYDIDALAPGNYQVRFRGLSIEGYRLPTEAEWEYASRKLGHDFRSGSIWEWTLDYFSKLRRETVIDPLAALTHWRQRVIRGKS